MRLRGSLGYGIGLLGVAGILYCAKPSDKPISTVSESDSALVDRLFAESRYNHLSSGNCELGESLIDSAFVLDGNHSEQRLSNLDEAFLRHRINDFNARIGADSTDYDAISRLAGMYYSQSIVKEGNTITGYLPARLDKSIELYEKVIASPDPALSGSAELNVSVLKRIRAGLSDRTGPKT